MIIDEKRCIGCRACSAISKSISVSEDAERRCITFHIDGDDVLTERLVEACPAGAISLGHMTEVCTLAFRMRRCIICGEPFATEREIVHVASRIPEMHDIQQNWLYLCPECRREEQRRSHARHSIRARGGR